MQKILNNITPIFIGIDKYFELKGGVGVSEASFPKFFGHISNFWAFAECPKIISLTQKKCPFAQKSGGGGREGAAALKTPHPKSPTPKLIFERKKERKTGCSFREPVVLPM